MRSRSNSDQSCSSGATIDEIQPLSGCDMKRTSPPSMPPYRPWSISLRYAAGIESSSKSARAASNRSQNAIRVAGSGYAHSPSP